MHAGRQDRKRKLSGKRLCAAVSAVAIAATTAGIAPASATVGPNGVEAGRTITVFHNIDMVVAAGWNLGVPITVEVIRNGIAIGSATGPPVLGLDGIALEVNHGPEGTPQPGDCWTGHTPDIQPGDTIRITNSADTADVDEVIVDDINLIGPPVEDLVTGDIVVSGVARFADGTPMPIDKLDSSEFRLDSNYRGGPHVVQSTGPDGEFEMRYQPPYDLFEGRNRNDLTVDQKKAALLDPAGGHMTGFGHVEAATPPPEGMLVEGLGDASGPALGCEALAPAAANAVTAADTANAGFINAADIATGGDLTIGGFSFDANTVDVSIGALSQTATPSPATGQQSWSVTFPNAAIAALEEGQHIVEMVADGATPGRPLTLTKDTEAPAAPTAAPAPGATPFVDQVDVTLSAADSIRYTTNGSAPTATTGQLYSGAIPITSTTTLNAIAVDSAKNTSSPMTATYEVVQSALPSSPGLTGVTAGNGSARANWSAPASNGFQPINGYRIMARSMNPAHPDVTRDILGGLARTGTVTGLVNGNAYRLSVAAKNANGMGAFSSQSARITPATVPDAPFVGVARAGRSLATVRWTAADDDGGADVTRYRLRVYRGPSLVRSVNVGSATRATVRRLVNGARYRFSVQAVNRVGGSAWSARSNTVIPRSVPARPRAVRGHSGAFGGRDTARVSWLAPRSNNGSRINSYVVRVQRVRANGSLSRAWVVAIRPSRSRAANVALRSGTYRFSVRAINGIGRSPSSRLSNPAQSR